MSPLPASLLVDGASIRAETGFILSDPEGWRRAAQEVRRYQQPVGSPRRIATSPGGRLERPTLRLAGGIAADTLAELDALEDALKWRLSFSPLRIGFEDRPDLSLHCDSPEVEIRGVRPQLTQTVREVRLAFPVLDAFWEEAGETVVALSGTPQQCPLGTAPSYPVVRIDGPATDPAVVARDHDAAEVSRLEFGATLASEEWIEVDMHPHRMTAVDGEGADRRGEIVAGHWFGLDPRDAASATGPYPTLALTAGTGSATYHRRFR